MEQFNDALVSVFEEQFKQKNLSFSREIDVIHKDVICDALKLKEIFLNILSNAIKYTPEGAYSALSGIYFRAKRDLFFRINGKGFHSKRNIIPRCS